MGSKMVLAEMCSEVEGSKRMMLPCALPGFLVSKNECRKRNWTRDSLTKSNVAVPHPRGNPNLIIRCETGHLVAGEKVPHNGGAPRIVAHHQTAGAALADGVGRDPRDVLTMAGKSSLNGQGVMVEAQNDIALGVEQEGCGGGAWFKGKLVASWSNARGRRLVLDI